MKSKGKTLAIVGSLQEAKRALEIAGGDAVFVATSLEAELYLEKIIAGYRNPLYDFLLKDGYTSKNYTFDNFKIAYDFCSSQYLGYFKDRLGYFLAELERSLDLAREAIHKFKPKFLIIGALKNYPGSSVVDGTLKTNAFFLLAKERKIPYRLIGTNEKSFSFKQSVGKKIQILRYLNKQKIQNECDLLILATPRHLIQMVSIINEIKRRGINLTILTYNVTLAVKKELDKNFAVYLEKERLIDSRIRKDVRKTQKRLRRDKPWNKFAANKYKKNSVVLNYIKWKIQDIIKNETSEIFTDILLAQKVLSRSRPKALLTTTDPDSKILPYIDKAKESGIKTICIQHGAFYGKDSPAIYPVSDFFIAWSEISKNWLKRSDYFKHLKILVGNSPFHHYVKIPKKISSHKQLTILYLTTKQPTVDKGLVSFYLKTLFETLSKVDINLKLIVRVHPYQDKTNLRSLMENFTHEVGFANDCSLDEAIAKSDLVIYENTTAGFDAMLGGKPTIYFNPYTGEDFFNVGAYGASLLILNERDLSERLPEFIRAKKDWQKMGIDGQKFARKYLGLDQSDDLGKITKLILKLIN